MRLVLIQVILEQTSHIRTQIVVFIKYEFHPLVQTTSQKETISFGGVTSTPQQY